MNFKNLMGSNCGEDNAVAQFAQLVVQDVARRDIVGQPSTSSGLAPGNWPPQSFRVQDLMNDMVARQPHRPRMSLCIPRHDSQPTMEYPESRDDVNICNSCEPLPWNPCEPPLWNIGLLSPPVHWSPYPQPNFEQQWIGLSEEPQYTSKGVVVHSLDQLDQIFQYEEQPNQPSESEQLEEASGNLRNRSEICKEQKIQPLESTVQQNTELEVSSWRGIPIYDDKLLLQRLAVTTEPNTFALSLRDYVRKRSAEEWKLKNPNRKSEITEDNQLQQEVDECPHIKYNPVRGCEDPIINSQREFVKGNLQMAIFYADEAARNNSEDIHLWLFLQHLYNKIEVQNYKSILVEKQILRLDPTQNQNDSYLKIASYYMWRRSYYEAFKTMVDWLKNHQSYGDIPLNFSMTENPIEENSTWIKSNQHIVDGVINMLITAARRNPTNADPAVQLFLSYIFKSTMEFHKTADCLKTVVNSIPRDLIQPQLIYNTSLSIFLSDNPVEALNYLWDGLEISENKIKVLTCRLIGIIHWYLTNYREAIKSFKEALDVDPSDEEFAIPNQINSLEAENELCLQLYFKLYKKLFSK